MKPELSRTLSLESLRLPLHVTDAMCECGAGLDKLGRHRAACPRSGPPKTKATPTERTLAKARREEGATVGANTKVRVTNVTVNVEDDGRTELLASRLPWHHGAHIGSGRHSPVSPQRHTGMVPFCHEQEQTKKRSTQSFWRASDATWWWSRLKRRKWSAEAATFVDMLASCRAGEAPPVLRRSTQLAWRGRWMRMLAVSCGRSFATSLVSSWTGSESGPPELADLLREA